MAVAAEETPKKKKKKEKREAEAEEPEESTVTEVLSGPSWTVFFFLNLRNIHISFLCSQQKRRKRRRKRRSRRKKMMNERVYNFSFLKYCVILVLYQMYVGNFVFLIISYWICYYYCKLCGVNTLCISSHKITLLNFIFFQCVQKPEFLQWSVNMNIKWKNMGKNQVFCPWLNVHSK